MSTDRQGAATDERIEQVERRLEVRRGRLLRHLAEAQTALRERAKPLSWVALGASAIAGFAVASGRRGQAYAQPRRAEPSRRNRLAALIGLASLALRVASNPVVLAAWRAHRRPGRR